MDLEKETEKRRLELEARQMALTTLQEHPGWKIYIEALRGMLISHRAFEMRMPLNGIDAAFAVAEQKGFVRGLEQSIATIEQHLTAIGGDLTALYEEIQNASAE